MNAQHMDPFAQNSSNNTDPFGAPFGNSQQAPVAAMQNMDPFGSMPSINNSQQHLDPFGLPALPPSTTQQQPCGQQLAVQQPVAQQQQTTASIFDPFAPAPVPAPAPAPVPAPAMAAIEAAPAQTDAVYEEDESGDEGLDDLDDEEESEEEDQEDQRWSEEADEEEYVVEFTDRDDRLGILIGDAETHGENRVVVQMVVDHSAGMREGILEGSTLLAVNGTDVQGKKKDDCTALIRSTGRPLFLRFSKPDTRDEMDKGTILARVLAGSTTGSGGFGFVGNWKQGTATWSDRFYVWAQDNLNLYRSEQDYQQHTVQVHEHKKGGFKPSIKVDTFQMDKTWLLINPTKVTHVKCKSYKSYGRLFYFALQVKPNDVLSGIPVYVVAAKFASQDKHAIDRLHESIRHVLRINNGRGH